jgi:hypothetical protein
MMTACDFASRARMPRAAMPHARRLHSARLSAILHGLQEGEFDAPILIASDP